MVKEIVVNARNLETRVAILENRKLVEILFEREFSKKIVGNIYKGRVENVLPGMQAAFVDVGLEKNVFLHVKDALPLVKKQGQSSIQDILQPGQQILVQLSKEALGSKGPRGTCKLSLPGRYLVLMNNSGHVGVSRRIEENAERKRLRELAKDMIPDNMGIIVRTVAAYKSASELKRDLKFLCQLWDNIQNKAANSKAPQLIHQDLGLIKQVVRDKFTSEIDKLIIDTRKDYHQVVDLISNLSPQLESKIYYYSHPKPVFAHYNIESEINSLLERKVELNCGGHIVIDVTEALTAIDVNTGSYVGENNLEDTILKTNIEAAREIAKQLRLRDIGGIIIIDFIDMKDNEAQQKVLNIFHDELTKDKTKTDILGVTELGLVEMTRKKERERIGQFLQQDCPYCQGTGKILSENTVVLETIRKIRKVFFEVKEEAILIEVHPHIASKLIGLGGQNIERLEEEMNKKIYIKGNNNLHLEEINIVKVGTKESVKQEALPVEVGDELTVTVENKHLTNSKYGISRLDGYIVNIIDGSSKVGSKVKIKIIEVNRTYALAKIIGEVAN